MVESWTFELEMELGDATAEQKPLHHSELKAFMEKVVVMTDWRKMYMKFQLETDKCLKLKVA